LKQPSGSTPFQLELESFPALGHLQYLNTVAMQSSALAGACASNRDVNMVNTQNLALYTRTRTFIENIASI
jgi:hypothetical protein